MRLTPGNLKMNVINFLSEYGYGLTAGGGIWVNTSLSKAKYIAENYSKELLTNAQKNNNLVISRPTDLGLQKLIMIIFAFLAIKIYNQTSANSFYKSIVNQSQCCAQLV